MWFIGIYDRLVNFWLLVFHPRKQGRAEIKADARIIAHDPFNFSFPVQ